MTAYNPITVALQWVGRGVPAFPVALSWDDEKGATSKRPLTMRGHTEASLDAEVVRDWFVSPPVPMREGEVLAVDLRPGPAGWVVLDPDRHGGVDGPGYADSLGATGGWTVDTASGGEHRWFRKPDPAKVYGNAVPAGWNGLIDVRADAGWVVAPGFESPWGSWDERTPWTPDMIPTLPEHLDAVLSVKAAGSPSGWRRYSPAEHQRLLDPRTVQALDLLVTKHGVRSDLLTLRQQEGREPWLEVTRPGKSGGSSASLGYVGPGVLHVFTTGWPEFSPGPHDILEPTPDRAYDGFGRTDLPDGALQSAALGRTMARDWAGRYMYVPGLGWHRWDGRRWLAINDTEVMAEAATWAEDFIVGLIRRGFDRAILTAALRYRDVRAVASLVDGARTAPALLVTSDCLDRHPQLLNTPSGVIDLTDGSIRRHDPGLLMTKITAAAYVPGYRHEDWDTALCALDGGPRASCRSASASRSMGPRPPTTDSSCVTEAARTGSPASWAPSARLWATTGFWCPSGSCSAALTSTRPSSWTSGEPGSRTWRRRPRRGGST